MTSHRLTPLRIAFASLLTAIATLGIVGGRAAPSAAAPPCPVPAAEYTRVAAENEAVATALATLSSQYEGAERDGAEFANAQYEAVVAAGYTFNCKKEAFVKPTADSKDAAPATDDPNAPTSSTTTTLAIEEYRTPKQVTSDSGLGLGAAEIAVVAILGLVALGAAVTISRS